MGKIRLTGKNKGDNAMRIGIDMGGIVLLRLGLVDDDNRIVARHVIPTELDIPYQDMIKKTAQAVRDLTEKSRCCAGGVYRYRSGYSGYAG